MRRQGGAALPLQVAPPLSRRRCVSQATVPARALPVPKPVSREQVQMRALREQAQVPGVASRP
jgi:hypothetical protein